MDQHADMADRQLGDLDDFLVAEIILKFELQNLLLPRRKRGHDAKEKSLRFLLFDSFVRRRIPARILFENLLVEISHAFFLSTDVEGAIAADGEEPFRGRGIRLSAFTPLEFNKCFLDYIPRPIPIAQNPSRILQKWKFKPTQKG